jgi:hypothetical protein
MARDATTVMLAFGILVAAATTSTTAKTTITYTRSATDLANIWVDQKVFEVLGGSKAPKFTGSAVSCGIIRWDATDNHVMNPTKWDNGPISAVLTTGDAAWAISKVPYKGGDVKPSYPDIVNSNIRVGGFYWCGLRQLTRATPCIDPQVAKRYARAGFS